jgi:hypothetical protein
MFNIIQDDLEVHYPAQDKMYINGQEHNVPKHVRGAFPYLTVVDGEVWINGYVYDKEEKVWHTGPIRTIIRMLIIVFFVLFMFGLFY